MNKIYQRGRALIHYVIDRLLHRTSLEMDDKHALYPFGIMAFGNSINQKILYQKIDSCHARSGVDILVALLHCRHALSYCCARYIDTLYIHTCL